MKFVVIPNNVIEGCTSRGDKYGNLEEPQILMGAANSHAYCGGVGGKGGLRGQYGGTQHPKHSRANLGATVSAEDLLSSQIKGEKKKRKSGLSTLKRKLGRKKKNWRAADHSRHFKESFSDKPVGLLTSILEHYEVCCEL